MNSALVNNAHKEGLKAQNLIIKNKNMFSIQILNYIRDNEYELFMKKIQNIYVSNNVSIPLLLLNATKENYIEVGHSFMIGFLGEKQE